jgi:hypothetical protein
VFKGISTACTDSDRVRDEGTEAADRRGEKCSRRKGNGGDERRGETREENEDTGCTGGTGSTGRIGET